MHQFHTIEEAFEYFLEHIYPDLSSDAKHKLRTTKYEFYKEGLNISHKRMIRVMNEHAEFQIFYGIQAKEETQE